MLHPPVVRSGNPVTAQTKKRAVTSGRRGDTDAAIAQTDSKSELTAQSSKDNSPPVSVPRDKAKVVPIATIAAGTASVKGGVNGNGVAGAPGGSIDATNNQSLLASVNAGANGASLIEIGPIAGGGSIALDRAASSVHFNVHRWWLHFTADRWLEEQYELLLDVSVPQQAKYLLGFTLILTAIGLVFDGIYHSDDTNAYSIRLGLSGAALFFAILQFLLRHTRVPVFWLCVILTLSGASWCVRSVLFNGFNTVVRPTESGSAICFLIILHAVSGKFLKYPSLIASSFAVVIAWIVAAFLSRFSNEPIGLCIYHALLVVFANCAMCYASYEFEYVSREKLVSTATGKLLQKERAAFEKEAYELRNEVYVMTLEQYDLAELDKQIDLGSPVEKAMAKLQLIQSNKKLPKDVFLEVKAIIQLLGSSSDIFKPQIEEELVNKNIGLDMDTENWLVALVNGDIGGRRKTLNGDDSHSLSSAGSAVSTNGAGVSAVGDANGTAISSGSGGAGAPSSILAQAQAALAAKTTAMSSGSVQSSEEKQFSAMLDETENWNFDVFEVHRATNGRPLLFLGMALFQKYDLVSKFKIDTQRLKKFLTVIERGYRSNPYHNSTHAADVTRSVHFFLTRCGLRTYMTDIEILAAIFAAVIHDYDHPGRTNAYHIATSDEKAILYNDRSVLENHHCAQAWFELLKPDQNFTQSMSKENVALFRKTVVELVLATDLGMHFDIISQFKSAVQGGQIVKTSDKSRLLINKMALKCGDLGHSAKQLTLHKRWTDRITEEFFQQGDDERKKGLTISPFMDRHKPNVPQSQVGFLDFLVIPMFTVWTSYVSTEVSETDFPCMKQLTENHTHWKNELEAQKKAGVK